MRSSSSLRHRGSVFFGVLAGIWRDAAVGSGWAELARLYRPDRARCRDFWIDHEPAAAGFFEEPMDVLLARYVQSNREVLL